MGDGLSEFAAAIAGPIDVARITTAHAAVARSGPIAAKYGIGPVAGQVLGMLRNLPGRTVTREQAEEVFVYQPGVFDAGVTELEANGLVSTSAGVALTETGVMAVDEMFELAVAVVEEMWAHHDEAFAELADLAHRVADRALENPGNALPVVAPVYLGATVTPKTRFAEELTPLRFIRFDAHIAAWRAANLTVADVQSLEPGEARDRIEAATNERAGAPYAALDADERATLLGALQRLAPLS